MCFVCSVFAAACFSFLRYSCSLSENSVACCCCHHYLLAKDHHCCYRFPREISPTHFCDKGLPPVLTLTEPTLAASVVKGKLFFPTIFWVVIFIQISEVVKTVLEMIREVAKVHKWEATLKAFVFIISLHWWRGKQRVALSCFGKYRGYKGWAPYILIEYKRNEKAQSHW